MATSSFIVLSSGALVLRGIYDSAGDLDIVVTEKGLEQLKEKVCHLDRDVLERIDKALCVSLALDT